MLVVYNPILAIKTTMVKTIIVVIIFCKYRSIPMGHFPVYTIFGLQEKQPFQKNVSRSVTIYTSYSPPSVSCSSACRALWSIHHGKIMQYVRTEIIWVQYCISHFILGINENQGNRWNRWKSYTNGRRMLKRAESYRIKFCKVKTLRYFQNFLGVENGLSRAAEPRRGRP